MSNSTIDSDTQKKLDEAAAAGALPGPYQRPSGMQGPQDQAQAMAQAVAQLHRDAFLAALSGICSRTGNTTASDSNLAVNEAYDKANAAVNRYFADKHLPSEADIRNQTKKMAELGLGGRSA